MLLQCFDFQLFTKLKKISLPYNGKIEQLLLSEWVKKDWTFANISTLSMT